MDIELQIELNRELIHAITQDDSMTPVEKVNEVTALSNENEKLIEKLKNTKQ